MKLVAIAAVGLCLALASGVCAEAILANPDFSRVDPRGTPEAWQLTRFHDSPRPEVAVVTDEGRRACRFTFPQAGTGWCVSFYQPLPELDADAELVVSFWLKVEAPAPRFLTLSVSGSPGCNLPCLRDFLARPHDAKWRRMTVRFPLRGAKPTGSVLELIAEREFTAGDRLYLADFRVEQVSSEPMVVDFTRPVSGVVFTDAPTQRLAGVARIIKAHRGGRLGVTLTPADRPTERIVARELSVSYPVTAWELDLGAVPEGRYVVGLDLLDSDGRLVVHRQLEAWRLQPTATTTRVIDGKVYLGDKPVILCGTYHVSDWALGCANAESRRIGAPVLTRGEMLGGLADHGFNSFMYTNRVPPPDFLDEAAQRGLLVIPAVAGMGREWGGEPLARQLAPWQDDPRIFGWAGSDEPSPLSRRAAGEVYRDLKCVSPRRLVVTSFCWPDGLLDFRGEGTAADLILMDIYRVNRADADLSAVGRAVRTAVDYATMHGGLAVGVAPQAFIYGGGPEPTPAQLRAQCYLGLVNGARAFFPYSYIEDYAAQPFSSVAGQPAGMSLNPQRNRWFLPDSSLWPACTRVFAELRSLSDVILDGKSLELAAPAGPVQLALYAVRGDAVLVAVNPTAHPHQLSLQLPTAPTQLTPLFDTPAPASRGRELALEFSGYEVKVLRLRL